LKKSEGLKILAMEQAFDKYLMFRNRLQKVYRHLKKWAKREGIRCFRIYDHDLPEFPFVIERYEDSLYVSEYKRNHSLSEAAHEAWQERCRAVMAEVIEVDAEAIYFRLRKRKENRADQYQKLQGEGSEFVAEENGLKFWVNLEDYLDTGLFLDHRITRSMVRAEAAGKEILNLFCYTGSFSVYALAGGAKRVVSADLSKTYLNWTSRNITLNFENEMNHEEVHADVVQYLPGVAAASFDLIVMDPPTFSNSKRMDDILDIQRDHVKLINQCLRILRPGGVLYFSTNFTKFALDRASIRSMQVEDITKKTTPPDFEGKLKRACFRIVAS